MKIDRMLGIIIYLLNHDNIPVRKSLIITPEFASMIWLSAILIEAELEAAPSALITWEVKIRCLGDNT
ncbi:MAG: hypothetical protein ACERKZ_12010 [Lachnotalea sp.]